MGYLMNFCQLKLKTDDSQPTDPDIGALNQNEDDIVYTEGTEKTVSYPFQIVN